VEDSGPHLSNVSLHVLDLEIAQGIIFHCINSGVVGGHTN